MRASWEVMQNVIEYLRLYSIYDVFYILNLDNMHNISKHVMIFCFLIEAERFTHCYKKLFELIIAKGASTVY